MLSVAALLEREGTNISWADLTWNGWLGCQKVSPACDFCYAEKFVEGRLGHMGVKWGQHQARRRTSASNWKKPFRWQAIASAAGATLDVFSMSLADWADNAVEPQWRLDMAGAILATPNLRWMLLTKRIGNAEAMLREMLPDGVPRNVALGITVCNQAEADRDIPRAVEVKRRLGIRRLFLSMEPLLGPVQLGDLIEDVDLVIVGGESGKDARPMHPAWAVEIQARCFLAGVHFHGKQWGEWFPVRPIAIVEDGQTVIKRIGSCHMHGRVYKGDRIFHFPGGQPMVRVGTKLAGRMFNGRECLDRLPA